MCSRRSHGIIYTFPETWQLGLGSTEEVQVLSEAGTSYASSMQCLLNSLDAHNCQS